MFQQGQTAATTSLIILNDTLPEDDEFIFIYITSLTSGVRVARPATDAGRKVGFLLIIEWLILCVFLFSWFVSCLAHFWQIT